MDGKECELRLIRQLPRGLKIALVLALAASLGLVLKAWSDTMSDPVIKRSELVLDDFPAGEAALTIALLADIHVAGPDMPPSRVERIVAQVNALKPDLVMIAGDFVSDKRTSTLQYSTQEAIAPLAGLRAPLGKIAVPGNHDHWRNFPEVERELRANRILLLSNQAVEAGPLAIGGLDDDFTGNADIAATLHKLDALQGARLILSHSPDPFPDLPANIGLMLAGHTHCGQIGWPWGGSPATASEYGQRYACGRVDEDGRSLITSGGLGTSILPFRLFTQPEIWLVTVGGHLSAH